MKCDRLHEPETPFLWKRDPKIEERGQVKITRHGLFFFIQNYLQVLHSSSSNLKSGILCAHVERK